MARPVVGSFAERLYESIEPLTWADEEHDWALLKLCESIGRMNQEIWDYARDQDDGRPGWAMFLDTDRVPDEALAYLGQFVGVQVRATRLRVGTGRNEIINPSFVTNITQNTLAASTTVTAYSELQQADTDFARGYTHQQTATGAVTTGGSTEIRSPNPYDSGCPVVAGQTVYASARAKRGAGTITDIRLYLRWYDVGGNQLGSDVLLQTVTSPVSAVVNTLSGSAVAPANARFCVMRLVATRPASTMGIVRWSSLMLSTVDFGTSYYDGDTADWRWLSTRHLSKSERTRWETQEEYAARVRGLIRGTGGFKRGTQAAMEAAAAPYLIGQQRLDFQERQGGAYRLTVSSYASETPDSAAVLAALISQKPAGILLTYNVLGGQTYTDVKRKHATYQNARDTYANYLDMRSTAP